MSEKEVQKGTARELEGKKNYMYIWNHYHLQKVASLPK